MTLTERLKDVRKRLDCMSEIKNLSPEDYQAILVSIIRDCQRDGAEEEREACAKICDREAGIYTKGASPEDIHGYPHEFREISNCAKRIAQEIRARSS